MTELNSEQVAEVQHEQMAELRSRMDAIEEKFGLHKRYVKTTSGVIVRAISHMTRNPPRAWGFNGSMLEFKELEIVYGARLGPETFEFQLNQKVLVNHPLFEGKVCRIAGRSEFASEHVQNEYLVAYRDEKGVLTSDTFGESLIRSAVEPPAEGVVK